VNLGIFSGSDGTNGKRRTVGGCAQCGGSVSFVGSLASFGAGSEKLFWLFFLFLNLSKRQRVLC
jgi:hypothetical protein